MPWIGRKFGKVNYFFTKMLTGHGYFGKYLHRKGKIASSYCLYKEIQVIDDTKHTVYECARYRSLLKLLTGTITAANIVEVVIVSKKNWGSVLNYVKRVVRLKKRDVAAAVNVSTPV